MADDILENLRVNAVWIAINVFLINHVKNISSLCNPLTSHLLHVKVHHVDSIKLLH